MRWGDPKPAMAPGNDAAKLKACLAAAYLVLLAAAALGTAHWSDAASVDGRLQWCRDRTHL